MNIQKDNTSCFFCEICIQNDKKLIFSIEGCSQQVIFCNASFMMSPPCLNAGAVMAISIEIQNSREYEDCRSSKFLSRLCALLIDRDLCSEPRPHLLLPLCERAAWQVLRDLPSFGEQERSKPPLGLLYSRQVSLLLGDLLTKW